MATGKKAKKSSGKKGPGKKKTETRRGFAKKSSAKKPRKPPAGLHPRPRRSLARRKGGGPRAMPHLTQRLVGNPTKTDLDKNPANYQPLTPLVFLERAARAFPDHTAIIHGSAKTSYADFYARARRLASALSSAGIHKGDTVPAMLANTPAMLEAHYGVPMCGAVLNALDTGLDAAAIAFMLDHGEAKALIVDREFSATVKEALKLAKAKPLVIGYDDREFPQSGELLGRVEYEEFLAGGDPEFAWNFPADEWDAIALNYTSGANPKGVVYHHRGAALRCTANPLAATMGRHPVHLWTLPMFHCNGWCFPWSLSAVAGTHVCLRLVRAKAVYDAIADHKVTHLSGAPTVMSALINAKPEERRAFSHRVDFIHAAATAPQATILAMMEAGFTMMHVYDLTETYGPAMVNAWNTAWDDLDNVERGAKGVRYHALEELAVMDPQTMEPVPADGETLGEVMFRGNLVMKGYLKNPKATAQAFAGGWFHSGDLGVMHEDGTIELKDRF